MDPNITLDGALRGSVECGVILVNSRGKVVHIDSAACDLLSVNPDLPADLKALPPPLSDFVRSGLDHSSTSAREEFDLQSEARGHQVLMVEGSRLKSDETGDGLLLLVLRDITSTNRFEAKVRHFERLARLGVLSASLAHELRNAMVALSTMTDLLIEQHENNELAQTVRRELDRANTLAVRMLKYARPNSQAKKPISTRVVLDRALQLANSRFKEAGASVTRSLQADPDIISADAIHLEQMFLNLLINAADAIDDQGEVSLSTDIIDGDSVGRSVRITVRDTGVGIEPDALPNLFEPFFTTKRHGTGLGLYLAHRIVDEHSGTIEVASSPGQGTCVQVILPVHKG